jgi:hypothetical protein
MGGVKPPLPLPLACDIVRESSEEVGDEERCSDERKKRARRSGGRRVEASTLKAEAGTDVH